MILSNSTTPLSSEIAVEINSPSVYVLNVSLAFSSSLIKSFSPNDLNSNLAPLINSPVSLSVFSILTLYLTLILAFNTTVSKSSSSSCPLMYEYAFELMISSSL